MNKCYRVYLPKKKKKIRLKVSKSRKQIIVSSILPKNNQNSLSWTCSLPRIVSFVRFFWRIEETIICFQDYLTFNRPRQQIEPHPTSWQYPIINYLALGGFLKPSFISESVHCATEGFFVVGISRILFRENSIG